MRGLKLAVLAMGVALAGAAAAQVETQVETPAGLPGEAVAMVEALRGAYARTGATEAARPPAKDEGERLVRLLAVDQAGWAFATSADFSHLSPEQAAPSRAALEAEIRAHDRADEATVMAMAPARGWFTSDRYGLEGANAALLIVQHAEDPALLQDVIARVRASPEQPEIKATAARILQDRLKAALDRAPGARETTFLASHGGGGSASRTTQITSSDQTANGTMTATISEESRALLCPMGLSPLAASPDQHPGLLLCVEPKPAASPS